MKRQYASIDIARYVSALLVVCIHTFPFLEISETFTLFILYVVWQFHSFLRQVDSSFLETMIQKMKI